MGMNAFNDVCSFCILNPEITPAVVYIIDCFDFPRHVY